MKCPEDHESDYFKNISCIITKTKNGFSAISAHADLILPVTFMNVHIKLLHKISNTYYVDFQFEYCSSFGAFAPFLNSIMDNVKKYSKNLVRTCPYPPNIRIEVTNYSTDLPQSILAFIPLQKGDYIMHADVFDQNKKRMYFFSVYVSMSQRKRRKPN